MSDKRKYLDVWIVESNTVYKEVPYAVVTDWIQQGRLLEEDRLKPAGTAQWFALGNMPGFSAYLPKPEPFRVEDEAEALEPVQVDFAWKKRGEDDDDDVDMIPLIDISLVLLIFFMMTAAVGGAGALIDTPQAQYKLLTISSDVIWIGIQPGANDQPEYMLGIGEGKGEAYAGRTEALQALDKLLQVQEGPAKVSIKAHRKLPYDVVRDLTVELERFKRSGKVLDILAEVSEKETK